MAGKAVKDDDARRPEPASTQVSRRDDSAIPRSARGSRPGHCLIITRQNLLMCLRKGCAADIQARSPCWLAGQHSSLTIKDLYWAGQRWSCTSANRSALVQSCTGSWMTEWGMSCRSYQAERCQAMTARTHLDLGLSAENHHRFLSRDRCRYRLLLEFTSAGLEKYTGPSQGL